MTPVWIPEDVGLGFLLPRLKMDELYGPSRCLGALYGAMQLRGVAAIHDYQPDYGRCEITCAIDTPRVMTRNVMGVLFDYIFQDLDCQIAITKSRHTNSSGHSFLRRLGGSSVTLPRGRGIETHEVISYLTKEDWEAFRDRKSR